ncbi:MAG TPA: AMP-binding protein, partial [Kiloniellales bacterium]|nr:AMP-binding protein [Kiloniellales bacterium]
RPLSPLGFVERAAEVFPHRTAVVYGPLRRDWAETYERCRRLAAALRATGIERGDTVAVMAPNLPAMLETHFGVPMAGAVLAPLDVGLESGTLAAALEHCAAKALIADATLAGTVGKALARLDRAISVIDIDDRQASESGRAAAARLGGIGYEAFLAGGDPATPWLRPESEWDAIVLDYAASPAGVIEPTVRHHRGAYLEAFGNIQAWGMTGHPVYLWTLPMIRQSGWGLVWSVTLLAGTHVCLRRPEAAGIRRAFAEHGVTHLCGDLDIVRVILDAAPDRRRDVSQTVRMMTDAAPPAAALRALHDLGIEVAQRKSPIFR